MFKVLVCDVDGTLVIKGGLPGPITAKALEEMHEMGILIGIASGRPLDSRTIKRASQYFNLNFDWDFCIGMNGCEIWDKDTPDEVIRFNQLQPETIREILDFMPLDIANPLIYRSAYDKVLTLKMDRYKEASRKRNRSNMEIVSVDEMYSLPTGKIEFNYEEKYESILDEVVRQHPSDRFKAVHTFTECLEFVDPAVDKGDALKRYCALKNIDIKDTLGIGDMDNDFELIRDAGTGVCMINGCDKCKSVADYVTEDTCIDDGFGKFFYKHYLNK